MSEILSGVEQREEPTELEEAGGAEVRLALKRALSPLITAYILHKPAVQAPNSEPLVPYFPLLVPSVVKLSLCQC